MITSLALSALMLLQGPPATKRSLLVFTDNNTVPIAKYQVCVDALPCTDLTLVTKPAGTPVTDRWAAFPAITPGDHTATVKACTTEVCSDPSNVVAFKFVVLPDPVTGLRIEIR